MSFSLYFSIYIKKILELNHTTKVPNVLYDVYQHVYSILYVFAKAIDAPRQCPGLLSASARAKSHVAKKSLRIATKLSNREQNKTELKLDRR